MNIVISTTGKIEDVQKRIASLAECFGLIVKKRALPRTRRKSKATRKRTK